MPGVEAAKLWLEQELAAVLRISPQELRLERRWSELGLTSRGAAELLSRLGARLGRVLPITAVWEHPTPIQLLRNLTAPATTPAPRRPEETPPNDGEPLAVIGLACRFPGEADTPDGFWRLLRDGVDAITEIPGDRWAIDALYDPDPTSPGKMSTRWGGFLPQVHAFEPQAFGISAREASAMDPQQRLALELAAEVFADAGVLPASLRGSSCGVFMGAMWTDHAWSASADLQQITQHTATGQDLSIIAARVSYTFGLQGPSMVLNTACSSALVAVHLAAQSLWSGESTLALAGGVNLILSPHSSVAMSKFGGMAADGRCKAFDARADGYVRGEGGGIIALKRLSHALRDGDRIYCTILGSAVNNDGFSNGLPAPNPLAQQSVLRAAYRRARQDPARVHYVEAHGTGTSIGDPIEASALGAVLSPGREQVLRIGSVKTNIGHLEAAAGIAGFIKVALSLYHRMLPASLHFDRPNPQIDFAAWQLAVQQSLTPWPCQDDELPLAGVSAFGFGGTNCHVVLQGAPPTTHSVPLPIAAASTQALQVSLKAALAMCASFRHMDDLTRACRRAALAAGDGPRRAAMIVQPSTRLNAKVFEPRALRQEPGAARPRVIFVCPGLGSQWLGMGQALLAAEPVFRAEVVACDAWVREFMGWSVLDELVAPPSRSRIELAEVIQPVMITLQLALAALWRSWGVEPDVIIGHSVGEIAAAQLAGILSREDALNVVCRRAALLRTVAGQGGLLLVGLPAEEALRAADACGVAIEVAVHNAPATTVVAGDNTALAALAADLQARGIYFARVKADYASHSRFVEPIAQELRAVLAGLSPQPARTRMLSTVSVADLAGGECGPQYWMDNLRRPVRLLQAVERLLDEGEAVFVELSPHPALVHAIEEICEVRGRQDVALGSLRRGDEHRALLEAAATLYSLGVDIRWSRCDAWGGISAAEGDQPVAIALSAHTPVSLRAYVERMIQWAAAEDNPGPSLVDVAFTLDTRRAHEPCRLVVTCRNRLEFVAGLQAFLAGHNADPSWVASERPVDGANSLVWWIDGNQAPPAGVTRVLAARFPAFAQASRACAESVARACGEASASAQARSEEVRALCFAAGAGALLRSLGLAPGAVFGTGSPVAAALLAGRIDLDTAAYLACVRVSGDRGPLAPVFVRDGGVDCIVDDVEVTSRVPATFWRTAGATAAPRARPSRPDAPAGRKSLSFRPDPRADFSPRAGVAADAAWLALFAELFVAGFDLRWTGLFPAGARVVDVPPCPWVRERLWLPRPIRTDDAGSAATTALPGVFTPSSLHAGTSLWQLRIDSRFHSLQDHRVHGTIAAPAALYLAWVHRALRQLHPGDAFNLHDVAFRRMLVLAETETRLVQLTLTASGPTLMFRIASRATYEHEEWVIHAEGRATRRVGGPEPTTLDPQVEARCAREIDVAELYRDLARRGIDYGPMFRGLQQVRTGTHEAVGTLHPPADEASPADAELCSPVLLDVALQLALAAIGREGTVVPTALRRLEMTAIPAPGARGSARVHPVVRNEKPAWEAEIVVHDETGRRVLVVEGLLLQPPEREAYRGESGESGLWLHVNWSRANRVPHGWSRPGDAWLVIGSTPDTEAIARVLESRQQRVISLATGDAIATMKAFISPDPGGSTSGRFRRGLRGIVVCAAASARETTPTSDIGGQVMADLSCVQEAVRHLAALAPEHVPRLWLVTRGAHVLVDGDSAEGLAQAPFWGMRRTLAYEHPELSCTGVDLSASPGPDELNALVDELIDDSKSDEIALRGGARFVAGLTRDAPRYVPAPTTVVQLEGDPASGTNPLEWRSVRRRAPEPGQVEIAVEAVGMVPRARHVERPGFSCIGRIAAVGPGVTAWQIGDEVVACAPGCCASLVVVASANVLPRPVGFDAAALAGNVYAGVAAWSVVERAGVAPGARVLIHGDDRVLVFAAALCRARKAEVLAITSTSGLRAPLAASGVDRVFEPGSPGFPDAFRAAADSGLDVILTFNPKDSDSSIGFEHLRPGGRIIELSPEHDPTGVLSRIPATQDFMYAAVSPGTALQHHPQQLVAAAAAALEAFASGLFVPGDVEVIQASDTRDWPRRQGRAAALVFDHMPRRVGIPTDAEVLRGDGTYLVFGGLGGLGLRFAQSLVDHGARTIVLLGRHSSSTGMQLGALEAMRQRGARVSIVEADVADTAGLSATLSRLRARLPPIRGIVHAAGVLADSLLVHQSRRELREVLAPKVLGAWNLHLLTSADPLDFLVFFSSATALLGSPGQSNHAAANAFLGALANYRRHRGLPALCIDWGAFAEVGAAARTTERRSSLSRRGMDLLPPEHGVALFHRLLASDLTQVGLLWLDEARWLQVHTQVAASAFFAGLARPSDEPAPQQHARHWRELLARAPSDELPTIYAHLLREQLAAMLQLDSEHIDMRASLLSLGLDSLMALGLRNRIEVMSGHRLQASLMWRFPTIEQLVHHLAELEGAARLARTLTTESDDASETSMEIEV